MTDNSFAIIRQKVEITMRLLGRNIELLPLVLTYNLVAAASTRPATSSR
jgi:hypothetical protein